MSTAKQPAGEAVLAPVFREAVAQADIAISITDPQANILYVNPAFERVTGFPAAEAVGRNQSMLSAKATPTALYADMWKKISAGIPWSGRLVNRRKDGAEYLADLLITPVLDAQGRIGHYLGIHRDVTSLHRLECQVSNQKALIESVVDAAPRRRAAHARRRPPTGGPPEDPEFWGGAPRTRPPAPPDAEPPDVEPPAPRLPLPPLPAQDEGPPGGG